MAMRIDRSQRQDRPLPHHHLSAITNAHPNVGSEPNSRADGIRWTTLLDRLFRRAREMAADLTRRPARPAVPDPPVAESAAQAPQYERLRRVVLTDDVSRTLFEEYAAHRASERGKEETGWVLLGVRRADEAVAL